MLGVGLGACYQNMFSMHKLFHRYIAQLEGVIFVAFLYSEDLYLHKCLSHQDVLEAEPTVRALDTEQAKAETWVRCYTQGRREGISHI